MKVYTIDNTTIFDFSFSFNESLDNCIDIIKNCKN